MLTFTIYPENGIKCVLCGENVQSVLSANEKIILHYLEKRTRLISYKVICTGNVNIQKYKVAVEYLKYKNYADNVGEKMNTILWVDEMCYVKMPWENESC